MCIKCEKKTLFKSLVWGSLRLALINIWPCNMCVAVVENVFYMKTCIVWQLQKPTTRNMCCNYCKYSKTLHVCTHYNMYTLATL